MKVGNTVGGLEVVDVKRVNKLNLIQFTKAVSEYVEQGYKIDHHSSRQIGLVLQVDLYKLEAPFSSVSQGSVGNTTDEEETSVELKSEDAGNEQSLENLEKLEDLANNEDEGTPTETEDNGELDQVEQEEPPVKKTRTKKTT